MYEPITLDISPLGVLTDEVLYQLCIINRDMPIERTSKGELVINMPTGSETGNKNSYLTAMLFMWNRIYKLGKVFDSSSGFTLPNKAMRSPDAAWVAIERWQTLTHEQQEAFAPLCPDFIIELCSRTDRLKTVQAKMAEWMENGCRLGWLIDYSQEKVFIYRADGTINEVESFENTLSGEDILPHFELALRELR